MTATAPVAEGLESAALIVRPRVARAPSVEKRFDVTSSARTRAADSGSLPAGRPVRRRLYSSQLENPASANAGTISSSRRYFSYDHGMESTGKNTPGVVVWNVSTRRSTSGNGNGRSSIAFTSVKTAVVAPMPNASDATATMANAGDWRSERSV